MLFNTFDRIKQIFKQNDMSMKYLQNMVATTVLTHSKFSDRGTKSHSTSN